MRVAIDAVVGSESIVGLALEPTAVVKVVGGDEAW